MDEPKLTNSAVTVGIEQDDRRLILWRNKWENEGTPLIQPGGGIEDGETPIHAIRRECIEEIGIDFFKNNMFDYEKYGSIELVKIFPTKWTKKMFYFKIYLRSDFKLNIKLDVKKFSGYFWLPINNGQNFSKCLYKMFMSGLKKISIEEKWC